MPRVLALPQAPLRLAPLRVAPLRLARPVPLSRLDPMPLLARLLWLRPQSFPVFSRPPRRGPHRPALLSLVPLSPVPLFLALFPPRQPRPLDRLPCQQLPRLQLLHPQMDDRWAASAG